MVWAVAEFGGESSKCRDRIHWTKKNVFGSKVRACWSKPAAVCLISLMAFVEPAPLSRQANGCELAYSKVQVECDICRACSIQDSPMHPYAPTHLESLRSCFFQTGRPRVSHSVPLVQEAGCEVHAAGKDPFDCEAALNNFFRAPYQEFMVSMVSMASMASIASIASMLWF